jgi:hypothetical protein
MSKINTLLLKTTTLLLIMMAVFQVKSQTISLYNLNICNDVQVTDRIMEFDLYLLDANATEPFELQMIQAGILINPAICNGGTISVTRLDGSSQLVPAQQPAAANINWVPSQSIIKLTAKLPTSAGTGTVISQTLPGTKVCRFRITNTQPFTVNSTADLAFSFTTIPFPTKVFQMIGTTGTQLSMSAVNCFPLVSNVALNTPPSFYAVSGGGSYCQNSGGLPVSLSGSESGVTYTLYQNDVATSVIVQGSGSGISFGNQLAGTYTVMATRFGTTLNMTGSAVITENPVMPVSISITANNNNVCAGTQVTFTAVAVNGGSGPAFQWKVNNVNTGSNNPVFSYAPLNGDVVTCQLTSDVNCASASTVTSAQISMSVNPVVTAGITVEASATTVCAGSAVSFNATPVNGGLGESFQWKVNGLNAGTNSTSYTYTPVQGDVVTCTLTSVNPCALVAVVTSNPVSITVNPNVVVNVSITESANTICLGTAVTYTATPVNGGTTPVYEWKINGANAGENNPVFTCIPANGDIVTCTVTSSLTCTTGNQVVSNAVVMVILPVPVVSVSITASTNGVCAGTVVDYTATPVNGGSNPVIQWKVNGLNVGTNNSTYSYSPLNGDIITCSLTSSESCAPVSVVSNSITAIVNQMLAVGINIIESSNDVCEGTPVTFTAVPTNGGTSPYYQWMLNGNNTGSNSMYYSYTPSNGDVVACELTSSILCSLNSTAVSNTVVMTTVPAPLVSVTINASKTIICSGSEVTYTAEPVNGGTAPVFTWLVNGIYAGSNSITFDYTPQNSDMIYCELTSSESCAPSVVVSNTITATVLALPEPPVVSFTGNKLESSSASGNQWYFTAQENGTPVLIEDATASQYEPAETGWYSTIVTVGECSSERSNQVYVLIDGIENVISMASVSIYPVPNKGAFTVSLEVIKDMKFSIFIYNNLGMKIFELPNAKTLNNKFTKVIDIRPVPVGVYTMIIVSDEFRVERKLVVD